MRKRAVRPVAALATVLGLVLSGCGAELLDARDGGGPPGGLLGGEAPADPPPGTPAETAEALRVWRDLPVDAPRRPIVLSGSDAHDGAYTGIPGLVFGTPETLPAGPAEVDGYPVIGAGEALTVLRRDNHLIRRGERTRVVVTDLRLATGRFWTDRGLQRLPAWVVGYRITDRLYGRRPTGTAYVLAVASPARFGPVGRDDAGIGITPDGMTLLVTAHSVGPGDGPCRTLFDGVAIETRTAVAFDVVPRQADPDAACPEVRRTWAARENVEVAEVRLARPLGNRVAVRAGGSWYPYPVLPCGERTWAVEVPKCAEDPGSLFVPAAPIDPATVEAWRGFAAYADPRPLVLVGDGVIDANFDSYWDTRAYKRRRWDVPALLPAAPARSGGYPVIGAAEALERLRGGVPESAQSGRRLTVTRVRLGTHEFGTDRGTVALPAWIFSFRGADYPGVVPAVAEPARFLYPLREGWFSPLVHGYRVSPDGRTLTVLFQGLRREGASACDADYEVGRVESPQAVVVEVVEVRRRPGADSDPATRCTVIHGYQALTLPLLAPLGGRAVVNDVSGFPLPLLPDAGAAR